MRIIGVSASAKGNTLLNYCKIGPETLDCIAEVPDSLKVGKFTPGTHIPVVAENTINWSSVDYALLLAWNWKDIIKDAIIKKDFMGIFIVPIPEVKFE